MKKRQFITAITAAGFSVEGNRVSILNDENVHLDDVLDAQGYIQTEAIRRGKTFLEFAKANHEFTVNRKKESPVFATVDSI